jgi:hypothetical protein
MEMGLCSWSRLELGTGLGEHFVFCKCKGMCLDVEQGMLTQSQQGKTIRNQDGPQQEPPSESTSALHLVVAPSRPVKGCLSCTDALCRQCSEWQMCWRQHALSSSADPLHTSWYHHLWQCRCCHRSCTHRIPHVYTEETLIRVHITIWRRAAQE